MARIRIRGRRLRSWVRSHEGRELIVDCALLAAFGMAVATFIVLVLP